MFDIGCVTCSYRINEGSKTTLSSDLQQCGVIVLDQCKVNPNISNV